jgi:hypothetical protein
MSRDYETQIPSFERSEESSPITPVSHALAQE